MKFKSWLFLFFSTLAIGGVTLILVGFFLGMEGISRIEADMAEVLSALLWLFLVGMTFSAVSQMGFFAYLLLHRLGLGLFKSYRLWNNVQIVLILFTYFDLVYFRYTAFHDAGESIINYIWMPSIFLVLSVLIGYVKAHQTNQTAFIPGILFMFVVSTLEALPAITVNDPHWVWMMMVTIFVCNAWQLLALHRLSQPGTAEKNA